MVTNVVPLAFSHYNPGGIKKYRMNLKKYEDMIAAELYTFSSHDTDLIFILMLSPFTKIHENSVKPHKKKSPCSSAMSLSDLAVRFFRLHISILRSNVERYLGDINMPALCFAHTLET